MSKPDKINRLTPPETNVRIFIVSQDYMVCNIILGFIEKQNLEADVFEQEDITDLMDYFLRPSDLIILDDDEFDETILEKDDFRKTIHYPNTIVLCSRENATGWQNQVLKESINDYFVIRPSFDTSYLEVQIWRALKHCIGELEVPSQEESHP
jgi:hypothetical protein